MKTLFIAVVISLVAHAVPAVAADAIVGTWSLDPAKSTYKPGAPPKRFTRTYAVTGDDLALKWEGFDDDGKPTSGSRVYKLDGKTYPVPDAPDYDSASSRRLDASTIETIEKRKGKPTGRMILAVSKDGKVLTLTKKGTDAHDVPFDIKAHYDRR